MSLHPKSPKDLALAPVAAAIDAELQRLRERSDDGSAIRLSGESVSLQIAVGAAAQRFVGPAAITA
jgi:hypothetical protein